MTSTHERPHPPRKLPRVLPTPPRQAPANKLASGAPALRRVVYEEVLYVLLANRMDEMSAVAIALHVTRRVAERATVTAKV